MQPTTATLASGGAAGLAVIVFSYFFTLATKQQIPPDVLLAMMGLLTWGAGHVFHRLPAPDASAAAKAGAVVLALLFLPTLTGCAHPADLVNALAKDPSAVSVHEEIDGPGWTQKIDVARVNSTNTAAASNSSGVTVNVPLNSTVNPGQATPPSAGTTTTPGQPIPSGNTVLAPASTGAPE